MNHLTKLLDKVASELEEKGLTAEAKEIDIVSNTLEKYKMPGDPGTQPEDFDTPPDEA